MRKSLLTLAAFALALTANAQGFKALPFIGQLDNTHVAAAQSTRVKQTPRKADLAANQRLIGYYTTDDADGAVGVGNYTTDIVQPGVLLEPSDYAFAISQKLTAVRFVMGAGATASGVEVFGVTAQGALTSLASVDTTIVSKSTENADYSLSPVWNTVQLGDKAITLSNDYTGYMISYKVKQDANAYPLAVNSAVSGRVMYAYLNIPQSSGGSGLSWYSFGTDYAWAIQGIVEGDFPEYSVIPSNFDRVGIPAGQDATVNVDFLNSGVGDVTDLDYVVTVDGVEGAEQHTTFSTPVAAGAHGTLTFTVPGSDVDTIKTVSVKITKVNGHDNAAADQVASGSIGIYTNVFNRNVVIEEFTTEQCPNCPRVAGFLHDYLEQSTTDLTKVYPVCHHAAYYTDWLTQDCDEALTELFNDAGYTYAPALAFNRQANFNSEYASGEMDNFTIPSNANEIKTYVDYELKQLSNIQLTINAEPNADTTQVVLTINGTCNSGFDKANGLLTVYLTEDNIAAQNQAGASGSFIHQHVIRYFNSSWGDPITWNDNNFTASYTINIDKAWKKNDLKFVAFVDKHNSSNVLDNPIYNSIGVSLIPTSTGIRNINATGDNSNVEIVARYNAAGQRIATAQPGLNILKLANGKTVKVILK